MASQKAPSAGLKSKIIRQIERPRPLLTQSVSMTSGGQRRPQASSHTVTSAEEAAVLLEKVGVILSTPGATPFPPEVADLVLGLNSALKTFGPSLESHYKEQLDETMRAVRVACKDDRLDLVSRIHLLELIELRAMEWISNENVVNYYRQKLAQIELKSGSESSGFSSPSSNELLRTSSLNANAPEYTYNPTSIGGLEVYPTNNNNNNNSNKSNNISNKTKMTERQEYIIKNSDSGRGDIDTIQFIIKVDGERLRISGANLELVKTAKLALEDFFANNKRDRNDAAVTREKGQPQNDLNMSQIKGHNAVRQPLIPSSSEDAFEAEINRKVISEESSIRRNLFAKTAKDYKEKHDQESKLPLIPAQPTYSYTRDEFLAVADSPLSRSVPEAFANIEADFPGLGRNLSAFSVDKVCSGSAKPTNPDWNALFGPQGAVTANVAAVNASLAGGQVEEKRPKKNFLEVLRPNAPTRTWDEALGEWVEAPAPLMALDVGRSHGRA